MSKIMTLAKMTGRIHPVKYLFLGRNELYRGTTGAGTIPRTKPERLRVPNQLSIAVVKRLAWITSRDGQFQTSGPRWIAPPLWAYGQPVFCGNVCLCACSEALPCNKNTRVWPCGEAPHPVWNKQQNRACASAAGEQEQERERGWILPVTPGAPFPSEITLASKRSNSNGQIWKGLVEMNSR